MSTTATDSEEYYCFRVKEGVGELFDNENIVIIPRSYNFDLKKLRAELVSLVRARRRHGRLPASPSIFVCYFKAKKYEFHYVSGSEKSASEKSGSIKYYVSRSIPSVAELLHISRGSLYM